MWNIFNPIIKEAIVVLVEYLIAAKRDSNGESKMSLVASAVTEAKGDGALDGFFDEITIEPEELLRLAKAIYGLLEDIGLFDDEDGVKFPSFKALKNVFEAVQDLLD